jgi:inositol phosphorylceramide mannosyltransferase catalytic subunit
VGGHELRQNSTEASNHQRFLSESIRSDLYRKTTAMIETIPKRIIQMDSRQNLPTLLKAAVASIRLNNPDFEHIFFDDRQMEEFVATTCPEYRAVFHRFALPIQRYDFFRYLAVYKLGGFYFDTDVVLATGLDDLLGHSCVFPFERLTWSEHMRNQYGMDWEVGNWAFGAAPGHPFLRAVIENCIRAQNDSQWAGMMTRSMARMLRTELYVIYTTGPGLVSRTLAEFPDAGSQITVLFPDNVCDKKNCWNLFGTYGAHLAGGAWRSEHSFWRTRLLNVLGTRNEKRAIRLGLKRGATRCLEQREPAVDKFVNS